MAHAQEVVGSARDQGRFHIHCVFEYMMNVKRTSPRLSRAESRALTRAALLAAGAEVFAERGYHRAAVEDIAERAGFTRGAFYANFRDKADLLLTLLDEQSAHNLDALDQLVERDVEGYGLGALATWFDQTFAVASPLDVAVGGVHAAGAA